jgi:dimethylargininase
VDFDIARQQWDLYVRSLEAHGWETVAVPPATVCPDSVFIEDLVVVYRSLRTDHRPAILNGGDVLKVGDTVYVGRGDHTNDEGIRQLGAVLAPLGATVISVPVTKMVIGFPPLVDDPSQFDRFVPVPEESGSHVVDLREGRVLTAADWAESTALIASLGYESVLVDISEFEKLEGFVMCLSVTLRTPPR